MIFFNKQNAVCKGKCQNITWFTWMKTLRVTVEYSWLKWSKNTMMLPAFLRKDLMSNFSILTFQNSFIYIKSVLLFEPLPASLISKDLFLTWKTVPFWIVQEAWLCTDILLTMPFTFLNVFIVLGTGEIQCQHMYEMAWSLISVTWVWFSAWLLCCMYSNSTCIHILYVI